MGGVLRKSKAAGPGLAQLFTLTSPLEMCWASFSICWPFRTGAPFVVAIVLVWCAARLFVVGMRVVEEERWNERGT